MNAQFTRLIAVGRSVTSCSCAVEKHTSTVFKPWKPSNWKSNSVLFPSSKAKSKDDIFTRTGFDDSDVGPNPRAESTFIMMSLSTNFCSLLIWFLRLYPQTYIFNSMCLWLRCSKIRFPCHFNCLELIL